jgi:hypothetical protein
MNIPSKCDRCRKSMGSCTMSRFNTDMICETCEKKEQSHPKYAEAKSVEESMVRNGNFNFKGIGKPGDLL